MSSQKTESMSSARGGAGGAHADEMGDHDLPVAAVVHHGAGGAVAADSVAGMVVAERGVHTLQRSLSQSRPVADSADEYMAEQGYPAGLRHEVISSAKLFPSRIWILDNSGSMGRCDGKKMLRMRSSDKHQLVQCSRWEELTKSVEFHADLANSLKTPTDFRLLNKSFETGQQYFSISSMDPGEMRLQADEVKRIMRETVPNNATPLTMHLNAVRSRILEELGSLTQTGRRIVVVIATDGLPSDSSGKTNSRTKAEFRDSLAALHGLPVWVVVRLLTDEEDVVEYVRSLLFVVIDFHSVCSRRYNTTTTTVRTEKHSILDKYCCSRHNDC